MVKFASKVLGLAVLLPLSLTANAALVSTIDIQSSYDIYNFSPFFQNDNNPLAFNIDMKDVSGVASFNVPGAGEQFIWSTAGTIFADIAANGPTLPGLAFNNQPTFDGQFPLTGIDSGNSTFDFDNQNFSSTSGSFGVSAPLGLTSTLTFDYEISAKDSDGILDDISLTVLESGIVDPTFSVNGLLTLADSLPGSLTDGRINGNIEIDLTFTGEPLNGGGQPNPVPEPGIIALLGLGLLGFGVRAAKKPQA